MESRDIEYKSDVSKKEWQKWMKTIVAFSNTKGGKLYMFYSDQGDYIGTDLNNADEYKRYINQMIRSHTNPIANYDIEDIVDYEKDKIAFIINVHPRNSITWLVIDQNNDPKTYIRDEGDSVHPTPDEMQELLLKTNNYEFDKTITGITGDVNSFLYLNEVYKSANNNTGLTDKILKSLNLISEDNKMTLTGLLFMDDSEYKNANLVCNIWPSVNKGTDNYLDSKKYNGSIISLIEGAINYIKSVSYYRFGGKKTDDMQLKENSSFSTIVLREAFVNAFAHRDYRIDGNEVCLDCYPDRIEITSPGSMLQGNKTRVIQKLESFVSHRRNQSICDVFVNCKWMEKKGSGFDKIIEEYSNLSEEYYPLYVSTRVNFTLILKNKKYTYNNVSINNNIITQSKVDILPLQRREDIINKNPNLGLIIGAIEFNPNINYDLLQKESSLSKEGVKYNIRKLKEAFILKKDGIKSPYQVLKDNERPCSIYMLENDDRIMITNYISNNCGMEINVDNEYKKIIKKIYITKPQFIGALFICGYKFIDVESEIMKK